MIRKVTKSKGVFTSHMAMLKLVYLATIQFNNRVENNILNWQTIFNQIMIYFDNRIIDTDTVQ